jgi:hypothetical protein
MPRCAVSLVHYIIPRSYTFVAVLQTRCNLRRWVSIQQKEMYRQDMHYRGYDRPSHSSHGTVAYWLDVPVINEDTDVDDHRRVTCLYCLMEQP